MWNVVELSIKVKGTICCYCRQTENSHQQRRSNSMVIFISMLVDSMYLCFRVNNKLPCWHVSLPNNYQQLQLNVSSTSMSKKIVQHCLSCPHSHIWSNLKTIWFSTTEPRILPFNWQHWIILHVHTAITLKAWIFNFILYAPPVGRLMKWLMQQ